MNKIGKYEIKSQLGKGGMGVVYLGYDPAIGREVAIKIITDHGLMSPEIRERFTREARSAGGLQHPNITVIYDIGEYEDKPFIVMELLRGEDLEEVIKRLASDPTSINLLDKLNYAVQICRGLAYSHSKDVIHRDIKPGNIRVLQDGRVKIMDFGIAKVSDLSMTMTGAVIGSPSYMSPEQIQGRAVDHRTDIFSFGVVFYLLLSGSLPFKGNSMYAISSSIMNDPVPPLDTPEVRRFPELQTVLDRCLAKKTDERYTSFGEVEEALEQLRRRLEVDLQQEVQRLIAESRKLVKEKNLSQAEQMAEKARLLMPTGSQLTSLFEIIRKAKSESTGEEREEMLADLHTRGTALLQNEDLPALDEVVQQMSVLDADDPRSEKLRKEGAAARMRGHIRREEETQIASFAGEINEHLSKKRLPEAEALLLKLLMLRPQHEKGIALLKDVRQRMRTEKIQQIIAQTQAHLRNGEQADALQLLQNGLRSYPDAAELQELLRQANVKAAPRTTLETAGPNLQAVPLQSAPPESKPAKAAKPAKPVAPAPPVEHTMLMDARTGSIIQPQQPLSSPSRRLLLPGLAALLLVIAVVSYFVWGGAAEPAGVSIQASPWARIAKITAADGSEIAVPPAEQITPAFIPLPPGEYRIRLTNEEYPDLTIPVTVEEGRTYSINEVFSQFDAQQILQEYQQP